MGLMLAALRSISLQDRNVRQGHWKKYMGGLLQIKWWVSSALEPLAASGGIGQGVRLRGGSTMILSRLRWTGPKGFLSPSSWERPDIISLHASGKECLLGAEEMNSLGKRGVLLVNTARGELIDDRALCACLKEGKIGYAALDVFAEEPYTGPLCAMKNVILTPHIGSYALESRLLMEETAISNLLRGLRQAGVL